MFFITNNIIQITLCPAMCSVLQFLATWVLHTNSNNDFYQQTQCSRYWFSVCVLLIYLYLYRSLFYFIYFLLKHKRVHRKLHTEIISDEPILSRVIEQLDLGIWRLVLKYFHFNLPFHSLYLFLLYLLLLALRKSNWSFFMYNIILIIIYPHSKKIFNLRITEILYLWSFTFIYNFKILVFI